MQGRLRDWYDGDKGPKTLEAGLVVLPSVLTQIEEKERSAAASAAHAGNQPPMPRPYFEMSKEERDAWRAACDA